MKRFILGLLLSSIIVFGTVYGTVLNPTLFSNLLNAFHSDENATSDPTEQSEGLPSSEIPSTSSNPDFLKRITKGDTLFEGGYYDLSIIEYQFAVQLDPTSSEALYKLGQAYFYNNDYENAQIPLEEAMKADPTNEKIQLFYGKNLIELQDIEGAKAHFLSLTSTSPTVIYYKGIFAAYDSDYEGAKNNFNAVVKDGSDKTLVNHATSYLNAMAEFDLAQDSPESYKKTLVSQSLIETDENTLAINLLYNVLRDEPDYRDAWILLGYAYLNEKKYTDAEDALLKAIEMDPTKAETRFYLGLSYFGLEEMASAVTQFELALQSGYEPRVQVYQKIGDAAVLLGNYTKAAEAYENAIALNSDDVTLFIRPVWLYLDHLNNIERALELSQQAIITHPDNAMGYNLKGWAETYAQDYTAAEQDLSYALILDPNLAAAHLNFGRLYETQGNLDAAKESYKRAYTLDPASSIGGSAADKYNALVAKEQEAAAQATGETPAPVNN